jgi:CubicO group peptidase (beta-lactamase class C family)
VRDRLARLFRESGAASLAVACARDGEIVYEDGFGWADRARRLAADPHVPYSLASITKPITATALLRLVEEGVVGLDEPLSPAIRPYAPGGPPVTVRQVANHTAGLPLHYQFFYEDEPERPPVRPETMRRYAHAITPPGERFQYSNLGYGILDHVVSTARGRPYAEVVRREVFEPLGMFHSAVGLVDGVACAARYGADGVDYPFYDFDHPGGSAVFASAHDLLRFGLAAVGTPLDDQRPVLSESLWLLAQSATSLASAGFGYGVGWSSYEDEAGFRTVGHTGGMGGVSTVLTLVPSERVVVVALANSSSLLPQQARVELLSSLLPAYAARRVDAEARLFAPQPEGERMPEDVRASVAGRWVGGVDTYAGGLPVVLEFVGDGTDVHARLGTQLRTLVNRLRWDGNRLTGAMFGDLGTDDARRRPHHVLLDLAVRDGGSVLDGCVTAMTVTPDGEGGAPGRRAGNALSHPVRLARM